MRGDSLFNNLICPQQQRRRDHEAESLGGLEVDDQFELTGLFDGKVVWLCAFEDLVDVDGGTSTQISKARPERYEASSLREILVNGRRRQSVADRRGRGGARLALLLFQHAL